MLTFAALDVLFNPIVTLAYVQLLGFASIGEPLAIFAVALALKVLACSWFVKSTLLPCDFVESGASQVTDQRLVEADDCSSSRSDSPPSTAPPGASCTLGVTSPSA
jgi:hypothetical protein